MRIVVYLTHRFIISSICTSIKTKKMATLKTLDVYKDTSC